MISENYKGRLSLPDSLLINLPSGSHLNVEVGAFASTDELIRWCRAITKSKEDFNKVYNTILEVSHNVD